MTLWAALKILRDCPAIIRLGVSAVTALIEAIDDGREEVARNRLETMIAAKRGEAAGRAAKASSDAASAAGRKQR